MSMVTESYYDVLQCQPDATTADIKRNYQRLVLEYHPDKNSKDIDSFIQIDLAWKTLRDPDKRKIYDAELFKMKFDEHSNVFAVLNLRDFSESSSGELQYPCRCGSFYTCENVIMPILTKLLLFLILAGTQADLPIVLNTWGFTNSTTKAWEVLNTDHYTALDALVEGCSLCEREQCDGTVGYGGSPDESGETTLDAMIMDGSNFNIGAVGGLREIKDAIAVARLVLEHTRHTLLVGESATEFAEMMGFKRESLSTTKSKTFWKNWKQSNCQPNFWMNVVPDPQQHCGPYAPVSSRDINPNSIREEYENSDRHNFGRYNHDTIGMIVIDRDGKIFAGTSTNGAIHKIHGRVGDSPITGAGAYADNEVGAAAATGDGDVMMRFLPAFTAVENLRSGISPKDAANDALKRIIKHYPNFVGGLIVADNTGNYAASCVGMDKFPFSVFKKNSNAVAVEYVNCI